MDVNEETSEKIEELQVLERNLQGILIQKQSIQLESNEISNALEEVKKSKKEVYKILGGIMVLAEKNEILKELERKKHESTMKINAIERQETLLEGKTNKIREEITSALKKKKE